MHQLSAEMMLFRCFCFLLLSTLTRVCSQTNVRPPWTMITVTTTSNVPFSAGVAPVISRIADPRNANGTIWLQRSSLSRNDVWSSIDLGATWELRSGDAVQWTSSFPDASYPKTSSSSGCSDPNSNLNVRIHGATVDGLPNTTQVWTSTNQTHWYMQPSPNLPLQRFVLSCVFASNGDVIALGTNSDTVRNYSHIWRGRNVGSENEWQLVSVAPWPDKLFIRDLLIAQMPIGEVLYVMGGVNANGTLANDGQITIYNSII